MISPSLSTSWPLNTHWLPVFDFNSGDSFFLLFFWGLTLFFRTALGSQQNEATSLPYYQHPSPGWCLSWYILFPRSLELTGGVHSSLVHIQWVLINVWRVHPCSTTQGSFTALKTLCIIFCLSATCPKVEDQTLPLAETRIQLLSFRWLSRAYSGEEFRFKNFSLLSNAMNSSLSTVFSQWAHLPPMCRLPVPLALRVIPFSWVLTFTP